VSSTIRHPAYFAKLQLTFIPHRDASSRLGVAASLKFFQLEGFFPSSVKDIPSVVMDHMATLLDVDPQAIADYDWQVSDHRVNSLKINGLIS
jgi:Domain of unknown function (DUF4158)